MLSVQQQRLAWRSGFFVLFILAPILNIFRFDLNEHYFVLLGQPWTLGIDETRTAVEVSINILLRFFLPLAIVVGSGIFISWKWGRLYCGWLCPHFSVVELINSLMRRASGKLSIWDKPGCRKTSRMAPTSKPIKAGGSSPCSRYCCSPLPGRWFCSPICCRPQKSMATCLPVNLPAINRSSSRWQRFY